MQLRKELLTFYILLIKFNLSMDMLVFKSKKATVSKFFYLKYRA